MLEVPHDTLSLFPELERDLHALRTTGTLSSQGIEELVECGAIRGSEPVAAGQIQPASIDLRLGDTAYRVPTSFLPTKRSPVMQRLQQLRCETLDLTRPVVLKRGEVYIIPLMESLALPKKVWAKANPKSTSGRLDVFVRVVTEYNSEFDRIPESYRGPLYAEVVPRSFNVVVHAGTRLCQLRFIRGTPRPSETSLIDLHEKETLVYTPEEVPGDAVIAAGLWVSADLRGTGGTTVIGYRALHCERPIDFDVVGGYDPAEYWEPIKAAGELILQPDECYILLSQERVRIPPAWAAEMVPFDPTVGEFRVHYAGFFDPGFGYGDDDMKGIPAVLEVRSHGVPFLLEDGQVLGRFIYERMVSIPHKLYGVKIGSSYQRQGLCLSKQFRRFEEITLARHPQFELK